MGFEFQVCRFSTSFVTLSEIWILTFLDIIHTLNIYFQIEIVKEILFSAVTLIPKKYEYSMLLYG